MLLINTVLELLSLFDHIKSVYTDSIFFKIENRHMQIVPELLNRTVYVHNGRFYQQVRVTDRMIGRRLGEFSFTKKILIKGSKKSYINKNVKKRK